MRTAPGIVRPEAERDNRKGAVAVKKKTLTETCWENNLTQSETDEWIGRNSSFNDVLQKGSLNRERFIHSQFAFDVNNCYNSNEHREQLLPALLCYPSLLRNAPVFHGLI